MSALTAGFGLEPRATRSRHKSCGTQQEVIPPSIRLDEPTTLNKERVGQNSEAQSAGTKARAEDPPGSHTPGK